ncbi:hypothetical protein ET495_01565 [Xylanimonas allomyrinae]|uniref:Uncharacterized protein n=1 Tax=Xylanimonas allomyrinae TaxID=2509459 RepID=A0A4P6ELN3_9MICO|nr:hypothetical protein [Xylanimonas allomyrinae]QAY62179.1 hypothetical protein ET495_01565 [Xylanimonas allomyrinae]
MADEHDDLRAAIAEIREFTAQTRADAARERAAQAARDTSEDDEAAASRRKGEQGQDWQRLQQRIDLRQTTLADIVSGVDRSAEARRVRQHVIANLVVAKEKAAQQPENEEVIAAREAENQARQELTDALAALSRPRPPW